MNQIVKDATVRYKGVDIAPHREDIRREVSQALHRELATKSINVEDFLLDFIDFRDEFKKSIEDKVIAEQNALAETNKVKIAEAQAQQVAATAQGTADAVRINAQGVADANNLINSTLTPELIQFTAVQKLAPNVQIALLPSGQGIIIDPATLLGQQPKQP